MAGSKRRATVVVDDEGAWWWRIGEDKRDRGRKMWVVGVRAKAVRGGAMTGRDGDSDRR